MTYGDGVTQQVLSEGEMTDRTLKDTSTAPFLINVGTLGLGVSISGMVNIGLDNDSTRLLCVNFVDERETEKVGGVKNLYGMTLSSFVFTKDDMTRAFTAAVTDTLRKAGYTRVAMSSDRITGKDIPANELQSFDYLVGGRIQKIAVNTKPGWSNVNAESSVEISLYVRKLAGSAEGEWVGPLSAQSLKQSYAVADPSQAAERALNMAIQNCLVNLVSHLKASGVIAPKTAR